AVAGGRRTGRRSVRRASPPMTSPPARPSRARATVPQVRAGSGGCPARPGGAVTFPERCTATLLEMPQLRGCLSLGGHDEATAASVHYHRGGTGGRVGRGGARAGRGAGGR